MSDTTVDLDERPLWLFKLRRRMTELERVEGEASNKRVSIRKALQAEAHLPNTR